jgi:tetratricopeptide (TPR) repeat protein
VAVIGAAGRGRAARLQLHWSDAVFDPNQVIRLPAEAIVFGYERCGLWKGAAYVRVENVACGEARSREQPAPDEPCQGRGDDLQSGQDARAKAALEQSAAPLKAIDSMPDMGSGYMAGMIPYYRMKLPVFYALEMRDWKSAAALEPVAESPPEVATLVYWARVLAEGRLRHAEQARAGLARYDALMAEVKKGKHAYMAEGTGPKIQRGEMLAWTAFSEGKEDEALTNMRKAADLQDKVGQAEVDIPAREMLADMLLEFGRPKQALAEYEVALKLSPNRLNGLYNAGRAAEAAGEPAKADFYYATLLKSTNNGQESARPELAHARSFVGSQQAASK